MSVPVPELEHRRSAPPKELLDNTAFLVARLGMAVKSRALDEFEQAGFSMYHYSVLALLGEGDCARQATIASALGVDTSQLVGVLDALEEQGLVERRRDPSDRRRHTVTLTGDGKRQLVRLRQIARGLEASLLAPLDEPSRAALHELLERVADGYGVFSRRT